MAYKAISKSEAKRFIHEVRKAHDVIIDRTYARKDTVTAAANGLTPQLPSIDAATKYLDGNGQWTTPNYTLPTMSPTVKGGAKNGSGLVMTGDNEEVVEVDLTTAISTKITNEEPRIYIADIVQNVIDKYDMDYDFNELLPYRVNLPGINNHSYYMLSDGVYYALNDGVHYSFPANPHDAGFFDTIDESYFPVRGKENVTVRGTHSGPNPESYTVVDFIKNQHYFIKQDDREGGTTLLTFSNLDGYENVTIWADGKTDTETQSIANIIIDGLSIENNTLSSTSIYTPSQKSFSKIIKRDNVIHDDYEYEQSDWEYTTFNDGEHDVEYVLKVPDNLIDDNIQWGENPKESYPPFYLFNEEQTVIPIKYGALEPVLKPHVKIGRGLELGDSNVLNVDFTDTSDDNAIPARNSSFIISGDPNSDRKNQGLKLLSWYCNNTLMDNAYIDIQPGWFCGIRIGAGATDCAFDYSNNQWGRYDAWTNPVYITSIAERYDKSRLYIEVVSDPTTYDHFPDSSDDTKHDPDVDHTRLYELYRYGGITAGRGLELTDSNVLNVDFTGTTNDNAIPAYKSSFIISHPESHIRDGELRLLSIYRKNVINSSYIDIQAGFNFSGIRIGSGIQDYYFEEDSGSDDYYYYSGSDDYYYSGNNDYYYYSGSDDYYYSGNNDYYFSGGE